MALRRPAAPGNPDEWMSPSWREVRIPESAGAARVPAANLARPGAARHWPPYRNARSAVAPLGLLAPGFAISVPDPKPLR
jgi:hypothetical protein